MRRIDEGGDPFLEIRVGGVFLTMKETVTASSVFCDEAVSPTVREIATPAKERRSRNDELNG